ncbi:wax ester/triacylglycerol synthase family O-acyltransferase [Congregibacter brevis]|uniref:diacylglycerol O-acyltransferase n=1 Tax=Congregibacter brevis TaxID=3081201 RepID=A0ABZ0IBQ8_9GAMM|nr:wax ester/triacylglycerol synthase family O-acyltransferase [Congregibacter sp. IMCC45268]
MQQLSGLDASFLYLETPNSPMHISGLYIYTQETAPEGKVRFKQILEGTANRVKGIPSLTRRLKEVPLGLDHPYWIDEGDFDPEFHIRHVALPAPGDWRQLCILISRIHARPLDRSRPLWEMYVIEGLDNVEGYPKGCFALFTKMHHAAVDGASGMEITAAIHDLKADAKVEPKSVIARPDRDPSTLGLLTRAQMNGLRQPLRFISVARNTVPGFAKVFMQLRRGDLQRVASVPRVRFNGTVSAYRVFNAVSLPLDDVKAIKNAIPGATVNDVALTIVGGAMRKYLEAHSELPDQSLVAMAPVNVRDTKEKGTGGNIVSTMAVKIRSDVADARERLIAVNEGTQTAKEYTNAVGAKTMTDYSQFIPSTLTAQAARLASRWGLVNQINPIYNCVITNVPGPQVPLYNTGARMLSNFGTGPVADGVGLFHVISSYCGEFSISATSCREMMPDPDFYRECLMKSFEELRDATVVSETPKRRVKTKTKAKAKAVPKRKAAQKTRATAKPKNPVKTKPARKRA